MKKDDFWTHLKLLWECSSFLYMLKELMKCHQRKNWFNIIIDFGLLSENKLQYRNKTADFWGWVPSWLVNSWHYLPAKRRQWENFLWDSVTDRVNFHIYICGLPDIWLAWLMQSLIYPPPLWKATFRRQSHCIYSKTTKFVFNTFHFYITLYIFFKKQTQNP